MKKCKKTVCLCLPLLSIASCALRFTVLFALYLRPGIDLVGRIADRGAEFAQVKEWMRIVFELIEMLRVYFPSHHPTTLSSVFGFLPFRCVQAHKKGIRRATINTFGYIAKAIGPQDVLATLLNNLKVQGSSCLPIHPHTAIDKQEDRSIHFHAHN